MLCLSRKRIVVTKDWPHGPGRSVPMFIVVECEDHSAIQAPQHTPSHIPHLSLWTYSVLSLPINSRTTNHWCSQNTIFVCSYIPMYSFLTITYWSSLLITKLLWRATVLSGASMEIMNLKNRGQEWNTFRPLYSECYSSKNCFAGQITRVIFNNFLQLFDFLSL